MESRDERSATCPAPLISVVTATYNAGGTLARCILSVADADKVLVEHIIVDGGSSDNTADVVRTHASGIASFLSEPDRGIYDAWNKGLSLARGTWIAFLGADDAYLPGALHTYLELAQQHANAEYISTQIRYPAVVGTGTRIVGEPWSWPRFQRYMTVAHPGSLHHRSLFARLGPFDVSYRITGDYELLLRARENLRTAFAPVVTVSMANGGVSDSARALRDAARAKRISGGRAPALVAIDYLIAHAKLAMRRGLRAST